jgi:hypothetical protein
MKNLLALIFISSSVLFMICCENEVTAPSSDFRIEISDSLLGTRILDKPFELAVNEEFTIVVENDAEFNTFWPGDTIYNREDTIIQVYTEQPSLNRRGISIDEAGKITYSYDAPGTYEFTFIAVNVDKLGRELIRNVSTNTMLVSE